VGSQKLGKKSKKIEKNGKLGKFPFLVYAKLFEIVFVSR
jgi:hypothetical protein